MKRKSKLFTIICTGLMAAVAYVMTLLYIPMGESMLHFGNPASMLAGLILGPWFGGMAAGIGAFFFDVTHAYGIVDALITFITKFALAMVTGLVADAYRREGSVLNKQGLFRVVLGCVLGGLTYIALYMLRTFVMQHYVGGVPLDGTWTAMLSRLPATSINNGFAAVVTPILYTALRPALNKIGVIDQLNPNQRA